MTRCRFRHLRLHLSLDLIEGFVRDATLDYLHELGHLLVLAIQDVHHGLLVLAPPKPLLVAPDLIVDFLTLLQGDALHRR